MFDAEGKEIAKEVVSQGAKPPTAPEGGKLKLVPLSRIFSNEAFGYRTITVERPLRDERGEIVLGTKGKQKGKPQPDASLRDTENVPLSEDVKTYFKREVLPHAPDAWIDEEKTKIGYEIPFTRQFYVFEPQRSLEEIDTDLAKVTARIESDDRGAGCMTVPRYGKYKASGVEWLGDVPAHWDVKRLGQFFDERREKVSDKDFEALSVTKNGVVPQLETAAKTDDEDNRKKVCVGDFVINGRSDRKGSGGTSDRDGSVSLINIVLVPRVSITGEFTHYLLRSVPFQEEFYRFGKGIVADLWSTPFAEMKNILLAVPPIPEQRDIVAFLGREIAKIDRLATDQKHLIELLNEKRQAIISRAATKGLHANVQTKNSGIEWIGRVPEHWALVQLRYIARRGTSITYGIVQAGPDVEGGIPYIRTSDMAGDYLPPDGYAKNFAGD